MSTIIEWEKAVKAQLEPLARETHISTAITLSTAISLKRIADFICGGKDHEGADRLDVVQYLAREAEELIK